MTAPAKSLRALTWVVDEPVLPPKIGGSKLGATRGNDMINRDDHGYYTRRAQREREIAERSSDSMVALAHHKMADEYERRIAAVTKMASSAG